MELSLEFCRSALNCYVDIFNFVFFLLSSMVDNFFGLRQKFRIIKLVTKMGISGIIRSMKPILYLFTKTK